MSTKQIAAKDLRPCPACPDGGVWTPEGPTGKVCPVCKGHAVVRLDGSPIANRYRGGLTTCDMDEDESL